MEFLFVFAFLNLLFFAAVDLSRVLETQQAASLLSRESAHHAFRECREDRGARLNDCLEQLLLKIKQSSPRAATGDIAISIFQCKDSGGTVNVCNVELAPKIIASVETGRERFYHISRAKSQRTLAEVSFHRAFLPDQWVYVAEARLPYVNSLFWQIGGNADEATVY